MSIPDEWRWCSHCHRMVPQRFMPSSDAGSYWRCSECGEPSHPEPLLPRLGPMPRLPGEGLP